eukprot:TRINITY_DN6675_c0_g1_i1.p1 TRINITY_DN6675_c0_g1~~TRINITY_DN6675_c0_g1_i1.p1  ORF type:complete len:256 (-),score=31.13 TRINITY_DN6675_c0_g1_i1:57-824(-)
MIQNYKDNGYVVGHTTASCTEMMIDINETEGIYFQHSSPDHSSYAFACDPNYVNPENSYGFENGPNGLLRRCLYKQDYVDYLFNYTYDFWTKYSDEKKFMIVEMNDGHDFSGEVLQYWDQPGSQFIKKMEAQGLLDDTIVILLADHGDHMNGLYRFALQLKDCLSEISLPMFYLNLPNQMLQNSEYLEILENLRQNQQKLVTMNNIHHMMKAIPEGLNYKNLENSVFSDLPPDRDCTTYPILDSTFCACSSKNEL